jgi:hypothetical protein
MAATGGKGKTLEEVLNSPGITGGAEHVVVVRTRGKAVLCKQH